MPARPADTTSTVITAMRYRDAPRAIRWLCEAFGFEEHLVVPGENGKITHAQLTFGNGMIMLGSVRDGDFDKLTCQPDEAGGATMSPYVIVADCDAHYSQAKAAGAEIISGPEDQDYGGRLYTCKDPEGHLWNFGTYDPWQSK